MSDVTYCIKAGLTDGILTGVTGGILNGGIGGMLAFVTYVLLHGWSS